jgi:hypothetical protein
VAVVAAETEVMPIARTSGRDSIARASRASSTPGRDSMCIIERTSGRDSIRAGAQIGAAKDPRMEERASRAKSDRCIVEDKRRKSVELRWRVSKRRPKEKPKRTTSGKATSKGA